MRNSTRPLLLTLISCFGCPCGRCSPPLNMILLACAVSLGRSSELTQFTAKTAASCGIS